MKTAQIGDRAKIHYTVKLPGGEVLGTSKSGPPLEFTLGKGKLIKKLEQGIVGMEVGESRTIEIPAEEGYGRRDESRVITVKKEELPTQQDIAVGRTVQYMGESGGMVNMIIVQVHDDAVTLDANHPFAGKDLVFEVVLLVLY
ncbi:MAG: FKBP-type peptidyl-prolyl cis-trans isomerase [Desulfobacterales bacterium]